MPNVSELNVMALFLISLFETKQKSSPWGLFVFAKVSLALSHSSKDHLYQSSPVLPGAC